MASSAPTVECGECGSVLEEATNQDPALRQPCANCGSLRRLVKVQLEGAIEFHSNLSYVQKGERPGVRGRRLVEGRVGDSQSSDGPWAYVEQLVDRINRRYRKLVRKADGHVVRDMDEPLDDHQGYGSAKHPK